MRKYNSSFLIGLFSIWACYIMGSLLYMWLFNASFLGQVASPLDKSKDRGMVSDANHLVIMEIKDGEPYFPFGAATGPAIGFIDDLWGTSGILLRQTPHLISSGNFYFGEKQNVQVTIDMSFQSEIYNLLEEVGLPGAVVVMDAKNSEIKVASSYPYPDPNKLNLLHNKYKSYPEILRDRTRTPLPIGSLMKIFAAAVLKQTADPYYCSGDITIKGRKFHCATAHNHVADEIDGISRSCTSYFLNRANEIDPIEFTSLLRKHFSRVPRTEQISTHLTMATELTGSSSSYTRATPIEAARLMASLHSDGFVNDPSFYKDEKKAVLVFSEEQTLKLRSLLSETVESSRGTSSRLRNFGGVRIFAKTGTADNRQGGEIHNTCWWVGLIEKGDSAISVAIAIDNVPDGRLSSSVTLSIAEEIIRYYITERVEVRNEHNVF